MTDLRIRNNKEFYTLLLTIMLPIAVQNLISSSLNLVDNVMIGRLGEAPIAAVGLANKVFFLMTLMLFGANSGASIFIAQYWGKKDTQRIKNVLALALGFSLILSSAFFLLSFIAPRAVLDLLSDDPEVITLGSQYLQIVCLSFLTTAISFAYGASSRSIGKPKLPMYASAISLGINTVLNWVLIFGYLGFEPMGVKGAAIATLIARLVEVTIIVTHIYRSTPELAIRIKDFFSVPKALIKELMIKTLPVILNETFWALGVTAYAYFYAKIGTDATATVMISDTVSSLFMVLCFGLGNASAIMIGNILGENNIEKAVDFNKKFLTLGVLAGAVVGVLIIVLSPPMVKALYNLTEVSTLNTIKTLSVMALFMPFRFYNTIVIIGTLRSGGDTLFSMLIEMGCVWGIGVTMAFFGSVVWQLPVYVVVGLVSFEEVAKAILGFPRIRSNKWAKNIVG